MAITKAIMQMRRGLEADFDPDKMRPGEWAVSTDKKYVRICFSAGVCVRMATYDAFEKDMEEIQDILKECQTIEEAVKTINTQVSSNAQAVAENTSKTKNYMETASSKANEASGYAKTASDKASEALQSAKSASASMETATQKANLASEKANVATEKANEAISASNSATKSAGNADLSESNAKKSEDNAYDYSNISKSYAVGETGERLGEETDNSKYYSDLAKTEADRAKAEADRASSVANIGIMTEEAAGIGKPDGTTILADDYGTISVNVENNNIYKELMGNNIYLTDSTDNKILEFTLYGSAEQYREPTPDNPTEIAVSGSDGSVEVVSCGKNLLENTATSKTINGITFTVNKDGSVTANGTATGSLSFRITLDIEMNQNCKLLGCPSGGTTTTYNLQYQVNGSWSGIYTDYGNGATSEIVAGDVVGACAIVIKSGVTVPNLLFKPMISTDTSATYDDYEPYTETKSTIPTPYGLAGIKVSSGGNYTDESGQQWICDEIVKYADGSGKRIQRIGKKIITSVGGPVGSTLSFSNYTRFYVNTFRDRKASGSALDGICNMATFDNLKNTDVEEGKGKCFFNVLDVYSNFFYIQISKETLNATISDDDATQKALADALLSENPTIVYYVLAEPIITDLSAEEIAEIEKLNTFYPITNISNDSDCGIKVKYVTNKLLTTQTELNISPATKREALNNGNVIDLIGKIEKWLLDLKTVAFSGSYGDLTNKPTTLDTYEEIMSNTESGRNAGAIGVKEGFTEVNNSLNVQTNIDSQISYTQPDGNIQINSIRAWTKGNVCGVSMSITNTGDWAVGETIDIPISGFPKPIFITWQIGLVVGSNFVGAYVTTSNKQIRLRNLGNGAISAFNNFSVVFTYPI